MGGCETIGGGFFEVDSGATPGPPIIGISGGLDSRPSTGLAPTISPKSISGLTSADATNVSVTVGAGIIIAGPFNTSATGPFAETGDSGISESRFPHRVRASCSPSLSSVSPAGMYSRLDVQ